MRASIRQKPEPSKGLISPVILTGGSGTRLWPVSTSARPKPFLTLFSARSLLQETLRRLEGAPRLFAPAAFIANRNQKQILRAALGKRAGAHWQIFEPVARNTGAAVALAALWAQARAPGTCVLILPADHYIARPARFRALCARAHKIALAGAIVTFGIVPTHAHTGLGYIQAGAPLPAGGQRIARFREKPDAETAARWIKTERYFWNSGMFLARADIFLAELEAHAPLLMARARRAFAGAKRRARSMEVAARAFASIPNLPFDIAVMEKSAEGAVLKADIGWNDIGSWDTLWQLAARDKAGNACLGPAAVLDGRDNYLRLEGRAPRPVLLVGANGLAVLQTDELIVIAPRAQSAAIQKARAHWQTKEGQTKQGQTKQGQARLARRPTRR